MTTSVNVGNLPHLRCWRTGKRTLTEPLESLRPTEMFFFTQSIHFDHFWTRLYNKALTSLTRDSPRCRLPRVEIFPVPMKRDEVSSKAEISAIRFSFCAKVVENRIEKKKTRRRKKRQTSSFILLRRSLLSRRSLSRVPRVWALLLPSPATWPSTIKHDIATILIGFWKYKWTKLNIDLPPRATADVRPFQTPRCSGPPVWGGNDFTEYLLLAKFSFWLFGILFHLIELICCSLQFIKLL